MVGQILFAGWGWLIALVVATVVLPGAALWMCVRRERVRLTRGDVALLLSAGLFVASAWGALGWARHAIATHRPRLEDDLRQCGHALAKYPPVEFQGYEQEACARGGGDRAGSSLARMPNRRRLP